MAAVAPSFAASEPPSCACFPFPFVVFAAPSAFLADLVFTTGKSLFTTGVSPGAAVVSAAGPSSSPVVTGPSTGLRCTITEDVLARRPFKGYLSGTAYCWVPASECAVAAFVSSSRSPLTLPMRGNKDLCIFAVSSSIFWAFPPSLTDMTRLVERLVSTKTVRASASAVAVIVLSAVLKYLSPVSTRSFCARTPAVARTKLGSAGMRF
mmetsp:Transcript_36547/g.103214  ORF Transcript_36547/g.103214 Transcript_36547/m.103214 type:complete len:208 (+) Transcript_36547:209-832(+)